MYCINSLVAAKTAQHAEFTEIGSREDIDAILVPPVGVPRPLEFDRRENSLEVNQRMRLTSIRNVTRMPVSESAGTLDGAWRPD